MKLPASFGDYVLLKKLGAGGMGDVVLARRGDSDVPVAIKRMHPHLAQDAFRRRFLHEAAVAARVDSPYVARVVDAGQVGETLYIAFEFISGTPMSRLMGAIGGTTYRASIDSIIDLVCDVLKGLQALHGLVGDDGASIALVHRDVAQKNIMLDDDGVGRLIDLGAGKSNTQDWRTATGTLTGTPGYMSPEQIRGVDVDHRTDLYSVGVVLIELLTKRPYIPRGPLVDMISESLNPAPRAPSVVRPDVPRALDAAVLRALAPQPQARFGAAAEMERALRTARPGDSDRMPSLLDLAGELLAAENTDASTQVTRLVRAAVHGLEPAAPPALELEATDEDAPRARHEAPEAPELEVTDAVSARPRAGPQPILRPVESPSSSVPSEPRPPSRSAAPKPPSPRARLGVGRLFLMGSTIFAAFVFGRVVGAERKAAAPTPRVERDAAVAPSTGFLRAKAPAARGAEGVDASGPAAPGSPMVAPTGAGSDAPSKSPDIPAGEVTEATASPAEKRREARAPRAAPPKPASPPPRAAPADVPETAGSKAVATDVDALRVQVESLYRRARRGAREATGEARQSMLQIAAELNTLRGRTTSDDVARIRAIEARLNSASSDGVAP